MAEANANTNAGKKRTGPLTFLTQVRDEGRKVTWTSRKETITATIMVMIMVTVAAAFFYLSDTLLGWIVRLLTGVQSGGGGNG
jgi:preprotein translocase subunit SecE